MHGRLRHAPGTKDEAGVISVTIPHIRSEIPLVVFRAWIRRDKDILEHRQHFEDHEMTAAPNSIEEAQVIQSQDVALISSVSVSAVV